MTKSKTLYLPLSLMDMFQLLEDEKQDQIFYEASNGELFTAERMSFNFKDLQESNFYIRTEDKPVIELGRDVDAV